MHKKIMPPSMEETMIMLQGLYMPSHNTYIYHIYLIIFLLGRVHWFCIFTDYFLQTNIRSQLDRDEKRCTHFEYTCFYGNWRSSINDVTLYLFYCSCYFLKLPQNSWQNLITREWCHVLNFLSNHKMKFKINETSNISLSKVR